MTRWAVLLVGAALALAVGCDSSHSSTSPPPGRLDLTGTWEGEAVVLDSRAAEQNCPFMGWAFPTGSTDPAPATIAADNGRLEIRFTDRHPLIGGAIFVGDLDGAELRAELDAAASRIYVPCSPFHSFVTARAVSGSLVAHGAGDQLVGTAFVVYRCVYNATGDFVSEEFTDAVYLPLHRSGGG